MAKPNMKIHVFRTEWQEPEFRDPMEKRGWIGTRRILVDWLNRAFLATPADRDAAERVGTVIKRMNESTANLLAHVQWIGRGCVDSPAPTYESFDQIASSYKFNVDLYPPHEARKWELRCTCANAPSGEVYLPATKSGLLRVAPQLSERWPGRAAVYNPEGLALEAVVFTALYGRLGTIKRCEVATCRKWFLSKDDRRVRCCPKCDVDVLRRGTPKRRKQLADAAKKFRREVKQYDAFREQASKEQPNKSSPRRA